MPSRQHAVVWSSVLIASSMLAGCGNSSLARLGSAGQIAPRKERVPAPRVTGTSIDGKLVSLSAYHGKVVLLNFFGSWCPPCQNEQPGLSAAARKLAAIGVVTIGIAERDVVSTLRSYIATYHVPYAVVNDDEGKLEAQFSRTPVLAPPTTLLLDRDGNVAARWVGLTLGSQIVEAATGLLAENG